MAGKETCQSLGVRMYVESVWKGLAGAVNMLGSPPVNNHSLRVSCSRKHTARIPETRRDQGTSVPVLRIMWNLEGIARANVGGGDLVGTDGKIKDLIHVLPHEHIRIQEDNFL
jgi:hypothetical protein